MEDEKDELLQSLPRVRDWDGTIHLYQFQGFWCPEFAIHGVISFQRHFQARESDLFLATFPKCGTTWLKALMFTIVNRCYGLNDTPLLTTNPHELVRYTDMDLYMNKNQLPNIEDYTNPRILSTHMPYETLPISIRNSSCRIVYICRNPLDQFISHWHFLLKLSQERLEPPIPLEECFDMFCNGVHTFGPFWDHVLGYWNASLENPNKVLFLKYEDMKEDKNSELLKKLAEFLGFPFSVDEERDGVIEQVSRMCSFEHLKNLQANNSGKSNKGIPNSLLFRKGKVGDWANYLTPSMAERLKKLMEEKLDGSGLTFKASCSAMPSMKFTVCFFSLIALL